MLMQDENIASLVSFTCCVVHEDRTTIFYSLNFSLDLSVDVRAEQLTA